MFMKDSVDQSRSQNNSRNNRGRGGNNKARNNNNNGTTNMFCTHCKMEGHNQEGCFKIIGYPEWWKGNRDQKFKNSANATATAVNNPFSYCEDQSESSSNQNSKFSKTEIADVVKEVIKGLQTQGKGKEKYYEGMYSDPNFASVCSLNVYSNSKENHI